ncbi:MAG: hypothetical protein WED00_11295 [Aquisalimonadaceae bacterium]
MHRLILTAGCTVALVLPGMAIAEDPHSAGTLPATGLLAQTGPHHQDGTRMQQPQQQRAPAAPDRQQQEEMRELRERLQSDRPRSEQQLPGQRQRTPAETRPGHRPGMQGTEPPHSPRSGEAPERRGSPQQTPLQGDPLQDRRKPPAGQSPNKPDDPLNREN